MVRPWPSNRSTDRRRKCSTAWSACSTANPSCAISRSSRARARPPIACAAISPPQVIHGGTTIAWVWDVYDRDQQRALRLSGEEPAGKAGRDAWAAADDLVLRRIAQAGFSGLTAMINGSAPDAAAAARAGRRGPAVASADETALASGAFALARWLHRPLTRQIPRQLPIFPRKTRGRVASTPPP